MPTIGVSLAVPEPWGSRLQQFRVSNGDAQGAAIPTHITLVPPVEVDDDLLDEVERHLETVAATTAAYRVHLRGSGTFRPVSIVNDPSPKHPARATAMMEQLRVRTVIKGLLL